MIIWIPDFRLTVPVAQWIARWTSNPKAVGSNPTRDDLLFQNCMCIINLLIILLHETCMIFFVVSS